MSEVTLVMECDGRRFEIMQELGWLLARCDDPAIEIRAPDLVTLRRRISDASVCLMRDTSRHVLHAGGTR